MQLRRNANPATADRNRLLIVLAVTALYCAAEFIGGYYQQPRADFRRGPCADRHRRALSRLLTLWISTRPASGAKTYGYLRAEILGALANGLFLWLLVIFIWFEAVERLRDPRPVAGPP